MTEPVRVDPRNEPRVLANPADLDGKRPTKQQLAARRVNVQQHRESGWRICRVECHSRIPQMRTVEYAARFVVFRPAALYGLSRRGSGAHYTRLEAVLSQPQAAHQLGHSTLGEGCRKNRNSELLATNPDPFELPHAPPFEVLAPVAETLVAMVSFSKEHCREQVNARRAEVQAAGAWADATHTYLISEGVRHTLHPHEDPWQQ